MKSYAMCALLVVSLSNCNGVSTSQPTSATLDPSGGIRLSIAQRHASAAAGSLLPVHSLRSTWISPEARREKKLLFISDDVYNSVDLYSVPKLKLEGAIAGFNEPQGMCTDSSGNVWVTNTITRQLFLLTHDGRIRRTLTDEQGDPVGCAIDPRSGDLAVTNIQTLSTSGIGAGDVLVYTEAHGTPKAYTCPNLDEYYFIGYDENGDVLIDGVNKTSVLQLCGGALSSLATITVTGGAIYVPGAVQWSRRYHYWNVFDQECAGQAASCAYWVTLSQKGAAITGSTAIANYEGGPACDVVQGTIDETSRQILGGDNEYCGFVQSSVDRWQNPAGGKPSEFNDDGSYVAEPVGSALSAP